MYYDRKCVLNTALYRLSKEDSHTHDAALFNHGVSGVDLYGASGTNNLKRKTERWSIQKC